MTEATSQTIDSFHGKSFLAVQSATKELEKNGLGIVGYKVDVIKRGDVVIVVFGDPNRPPNAVGSSGPKPNFEVYLDANDLSVIRSHFVK